MFVTQGLFDWETLLGALTVPVFTSKASASNNCGMHGYDNEDRFHALVATRQDLVGLFFLRWAQWGAQF